MAATPTPVAATPAPVTTPAHLFGLQVFHFLPGGKRGTRLLIRRRQPSVLCERMRRKRRGLRARSQRGSARGKPKGELQKVAAFHDISSVVHGK